MTLIKYNPILAPSTFSSLFERLFTDNNSSDYAQLRFIPEVDLTETDTKYEVHVSLPGFKKEDIKVEFQDGFLIISGERKLVKENKIVHSIESNYGSFSRRFSLPDNADANKISAKFNNGILEVEIEKDSKKSLTHKIDIR